MKKKNRAYKIAIDFDGTIAEHNFPGIGPEAKYVFDYLKQFQEAGAKLILWTMRSDGQKAGPVLTAAIDFCKERGIEFDSVNKGINDRFWTKSNKADADIYIDDKAFGCPMTSTAPWTADWSIIGPAVLKFIKGED